MERYVFDSNYKYAGSITLLLLQLIVRCVYRLGLKILKLNKYIISDRSPFLSELPASLRST
jgi:hypothetical protein